MAVIQRIAHYLGWVSSGLAALVRWLCLAMAITTLVVVVLRYGFNIGWIALQESITYQHACVFMLYAAFAFRQDEHVRVDVFYRNWSTRRKTLVDMFGTVAFLLPLCVTLLVYSYDYVLTSWSLLETSQEAGGLPFVYLLKSLIPALSILLILEAIKSICEGIVVLVSEQTSSIHAEESH